MRTLIKVTLDVAASNKAIKDGSLPKLIESTMKRIKPEASYFLTDNGSRCCIMVCDLKDPSEIPAITEPFFMQMNARVDLSPCMNADELKKGLETWMKSGAEMTMA